MILSNFFLLKIIYFKARQKKLIIQFKKIQKIDDFKEQM